MPRRLPRPFGVSISATRMVSLVMLLAVLWVMYDRIRDPATWHWLAPPSADINPATAPVTAGPPEEIIPGPNDLDEDAAGLMQTRLKAVTDGTPLRTRDMPAYWQLMAWSRTQPLRELERRASREPTFSQLWEEPGDYRGRPFRLKLNVRRVLRYKAPENPLDLQVAYEAWGWTDGSKSFPYVVVFPELPPGLTVGDEMQGEVIFTGYFLKVMSYTAFDAKRGAPLFIGRARSVTPAVAPSASSSSTAMGLLTVLLGAVICAGLAGWHWMSRRKVAATSALPDEIGFDPASFSDSSDRWPADDTREFPQLDFGPASEPKPSSADSPDARTKAASAP